MVLSRRNVEQTLGGKLGMVMDQRDHRYYRLYVEGQFILKTKVSTGTGHGTIAPQLVSLMAKQLRVPAPFFRDLDACTKTREDYLSHLRGSGVIR